MATGDLSHVSQDLVGRLRSVERRVQRLAIARGVGLVIVAGSVLLLSCVLVDMAWELPLAARIGMLAFFCGALAGLVCRYVVWPALRRASDSEAAALVESAHPELQERLSSTIELTDPRIPENERGSQLMRALLLRQTEQQVANTDVGDAVSAQPASRWSFFAAVSLGILVIPYIFLGNNYGLLLTRFFSPWQNLERAADVRFDVEPGDTTIARGSDVEIVATPRLRNPDEADEQLQVRLNWESVVGSSDSRRMLWDNQRAVYVATVPHVFQTFDFNVSADRARTRDFHVEVVEAPVVTEFRIMVEPPAYTGRPVNVVDAGVRDVWVFEGSRLVIDAQFNKPLRDVTLRWLPAINADLADGSEETLQTTVETPFALAPDGRSATLEWDAVLSGEFAVAGVDEHGLENAPLLRSLRVITDGPPSIMFTDDEFDPAARPDDIVPVPILATDDVGVAELELHYEVVTGESGEGVLVAESRVLGASAIEHEFQLDLGPLGLTDGAIVSIRARAADERPVPGPNEAWTDTRLISIDSNADPYGHRAVAERQRQMRELLTALREETEANRDAVSALRAEADQRQQLEFERNDELAPLAARQFDLAERVEQLAALFDLHPLFGNLSEATRSIAENDLTEAGNSTRHAESAALLPEKVEELQAGVRRLDEAVAEFAELERRFDELAALERDLLELRRLADQTNRLAESVADYQERREQPLPSGASPEQQARRQQSLESERANLQLDQQELSNDLDDMLDRRPELVDAALQHQLEQFQELMQLANELANREQALANSLESDANAPPGIDEQHRQLMDRASELAADPNLESADPLDLERLRESLAAFEEGDLDQARQRLEEAAAALADLRDQFARNEALSADPQQAAEELARRQREIQEQLNDNADESADAAARAQAAVRAATAQLPVPEHAREQQQAAADAASETLERIAEGDPEEAAAAADRAEDALEQLAAQIGTPEERRARALERLQRLREQQQELARQVEERTRDASDPQAADALREFGPQQEQLVQNVAQLDAPGAETEQQAATQRSQQAARELQAGETESASRSQANAEHALAELQRRLAGEPTTAETLERLQREQQAIAEATEQAVAAEDPSDLTQQAARQQNLADEVGDLDVPAATAQRDRGEQAAADAAEAIRGSAEDPGLGDDALAAVESSQEALQQLAEQLSASSVPAPAGESQPGDAPGSEIAQALEDLARQQQELADGMEMSQAQQPPSPGESGRQAPSRSASNPLAEQSQLAQEAAEFALEAARQRGSESGAAQEARQFASHAAEATRQTATGQPAAAAESARQATAAAQQSAESLRSPAAGEGEAQPELAQQGEELAQRQLELAEQLAQAAASPSARRAMQQQGQERLAQATEQLERELRTVAEQLAAQPLERNDEAQDAATSQQASQQARSQMESARSQIGNEQLSRAAESARQAAESLRQAAQASATQGQEGQPQSEGQPAEGADQEGQQGQGEQGHSPVPGQVGQQVAQASQQLRQAGEQLEAGAAQQGSPMGNESPQGEPAGEGDPMSEGATPQSGEGTGQPSSAESLRQAAQALQNAAAGLQPSGSGQQQAGQMPNPGQPPSQSPGTPDDSGNPGGGTSEGLSLAELESQLQELSTRRWGELPGTLQTQLREASRQRPDGDYSRLIRLYFEDVARSRAPEGGNELRREVENDN